MMSIQNKNKDKNTIENLKRHKDSFVVIGAEMYSDNNSKKKKIKDGVHKMINLRL